jgi:hypothetical protein
MRPRVPTRKSKRIDIRNVKVLSYYRLKIRDKLALEVLSKYREFTELFSKELIEDSLLVY